MLTRAIVPVPYSLPPRTSAMPDVRHAAALRREIARLARDRDHHWQRSAEWRQRIEERIQELRAELEAET